MNKQTMFHPDLCAGELTRVTAGVAHRGYEASKPLCQSVDVKHNYEESDVVNSFSPTITVICYTKLGFGGAQRDSNQRLMYTWA